MFATTANDPKELYGGIKVDGDVYQIDTSKISNKWYKDMHYAWRSTWPEYKAEQIVSFEKIPPEAIELIQQGEGEYYAGLQNR